MIYRQNDAISFFQFPHLAEFAELRHGVFTRLGGVSTGAFQSLNVSMSGGDEASNVIQNRLAVSRCMGGAELVFLNQVHGTDVINVRESVAASEAGGFCAGSGDALISRLPGVSMLIQTADCQSVLIFDPVQRAVGNVHSGWRGSLHNIIGRTVQAMIAAFGTDPATLLVGIGPSLGPCCAEFIHYRTEIPRHFWSYKNSADHFDFWALSRDQLTEAGVPEDHIVCSNLCTRCRTDIFFSYRKEHVTGRFAAVIGLV